MWEFFFCICVNTYNFSLTVYSMYCLVVECEIKSHTNKLILLHVDMLINFFFSNFSHTYDIFHTKTDEAVHPIYEISFRTNPQEVQIV